MMIVMDGQLHITDMPPDLYSQVTRELTVPNPDYLNALRMGRPLYGIQKNILLFEVQNNELLLPRGMIMRLWGRRPKGTVCQDRTHTGEPVDFPRCSIQLRGYQEKVCSTVLANAIPQGVILAPCGSGKTEMGLYLVAMRRQPALWITHTRDLLDQTVERARDRLGLQPGELGVLTGGERRIGSHLTVATVQTLYHMELDELAMIFGTVIVDECHRVVNNPQKASMFTRVLSGLPAKYRYGLTASDHRGDGLEDTIFQVLGERIAAVDPEELKEGGNTVIPMVQPVYTDFTYHPAPKETRIDPSRLLKYIGKDEDRRSVVLRYLTRELRAGHSCICLAQSLEILEKLQVALDKAGLPSEYICGGTRKDHRTAAIRNMREGRAHCLLATYQLAKEGLDIPRADRLFLVSSVRDRVTIQQSVGRIMRPAPDKADAVVYDFVDYKVPQCRAQYNARKRVYQDLQAQIEKEIKA